jgi:hypothetical protein
MLVSFPASAFQPTLLTSLLFVDALPAVLLLQANQP